MYCSVCKASKKKNTLTSESTNFRTSTLVRHIESRDHRGKCNRAPVCAADGNDDKEIFFQRRSTFNNTIRVLLVEYCIGLHNILLILTL